MKKSLFLVIVALFLTAGAVKAQNSDTQKYEGKIGKYEITLFIDRPQYDGDSIGYYYYNNRPNTKFKLVQRDYSALNARGSMHVLLDEYTPKGNHTGTFDGQLECRGSSFKGTFTNSKGKKFKFELWEQYGWQ